MEQLINDITTAFGHLFSGTALSGNDIQCIVLCAMLVILIVLLLVISFQTLFWTRIGWFFEDVWHRLKRYTMPIPGTSLCDDDLTEEDIHEIMNLIHKGNPPKYEIKKTEDGRNYMEIENQKK